MTHSKFTLNALASGIVALSLATATSHVAAQSEQSGQAGQQQSGQQSQQMRAQGSQAQQKQQQQQQSRYRAVRANELIGMEVTNAQGRTLGSIEDLVVNVESGDVRYAVMSFDPGILTDETLFAVPLNQLRMGAGADRLVYENMDRERLAVAAIRRSEWADRTNIAERDRETMARMDKAYGIQQPMGTARAMRVSELLDRDLVSATGDEVGEIESVVINMNNQKVHYLVVDFDPGWLSPERKVAVPLNAVTLAQNEDELLLNMDRAQARRMQPLEDDWFANMNEPSYVAETERYLVTAVLVPADATGATGATGAMGAGGNQQFSQLDRDKNDQLDRSEVQSAQQIRENWTQADRDNNGWITQQEFQRFQQQNQSAGAGQSGGGQQASGGSGQSGGGASQMGAGGNQFNQLDRDDNQWLDRSEVESAANIRDNWKQFDADNDGRIGLQEFQQGQRQQGQQQRQ